MRISTIGWLLAFGLSAAGMSGASFAAEAAAAIKIRPLTGLTIVTAVHEEEGDYESIKRIVSAGADGYTLEYSADVPVGAEGGVLGALFGTMAGEQTKSNARAAGTVRQVRTRRTVRRDDLAGAREYMQHFSERLPATIPGTTALGVSRAVLMDLRTKGAARIALRNVGPFGTVGTGISSLIEGMAGELADAVDTSELEAIDKITGTLRRVSGEAGALPVLIDGRPKQLSVLRARGTLGDQPVDMSLLDDPDNPLALAWKIGEFNRLRVVQIHLPLPASGTRSAGIERQLADTGRAVVYGVYFDFNSAAIKPESKPALDEIAAALKQHPAWKLSVEGHTDSIGNESSNQRLSERRAAAVRSALTDRYGIGKSRLSAAGFGESRPKASNETLQGRARNRRVELVRSVAGGSS